MTLGADMGLTYFKRFRMQIDLSEPLFPPPPICEGYAFLAWRRSLLEAHAEAKYLSFNVELDANVFPCLGDRDGCLQLMSEITRRDGFVREATWLLQFRGPVGSKPLYCGTVQGLRDRGGSGAVQNLGVAPGHRGKGLGTALLRRALIGFQQVGLQRAYLEVTAQNYGAVRLYERLGFRKVKTVYKAAEIACI